MWISRLSFCLWCWCISHWRRKLASISAAPFFRRRTIFILARKQYLSLECAVSFLPHGVGHKKSLCSWHDKFITCDWGSTTGPLGLTNDTVALVLNFNYLIDIVPEQGQKTRRTIFWLHLHSSLWSNGEHQGFYSIFRENWSISKPEQAWTQHLKTSKTNSAKPGEVDSGPVIDGLLWAGRVLSCSAGSSVFVCRLLALARNGQQACPSWNARSTTDIGLCTHQGYSPRTFEKICRLLTSLLTNCTTAAIWWQPFGNRGKICEFSGKPGNSLEQSY